MKVKPSLWLMVVMLMFPQIVETIYSPALGSISQSFAVSDTQAAQTLSIYFSAFAIGVAAWGVLADFWGRRPAMLLGLLIYSCAAFVAMQTESFTVLMIARAFSAFGIAVGSVVTQTMLRDAFDGEALGKVFSLMGLGIAISPVIGMFCGGQLSQAGGHQFVFFALFAMAIGLLIYNFFLLPETQTEKQPLKLGALSARMLKDVQIWQSALLVAFYNIALFAYYQLGGFHVAALGFTSEQFGYSGLVLGIGSLLGSFLNKGLLTKNVSQHLLLKGAGMMFTLGAVGVYTMLDSIWFLIPIMIIVTAYGIAIPNILSMALSNYRQQAGSAAALFGLMYYLFIGSGLGLAGIIQHLGTVLIACGVGAMIVTYTLSSRVAAA
ncbi:multidrug effflux MFS transporter [Photobacterium galatheae]|uniref:Major facilitator transporter n=1 Tax=Photobacterium galatheae TaxID=1654360 RepID=A0A066RRX7_9GAMM|nr:multidrug effflux MFS transporter [Photobacterium galatheae]KDM93160.1 major facilitator transporter [Photobacterium galatheae]MCM0148311.1 multidrug effflux MFS transporter [Photobacterium galatheae]